MWPALKMVFSKSEIKTFEVLHSHHRYRSGIGDFSTGLDTILGVKHVDVVERLGLFLDGDQAYFKFKSTWRTEGGRGKLI